MSRLPLRFLEYQVLDPTSASAHTSRKLVEYKKLIVSLLHTARKIVVKYQISTASPTIPQLLDINRVSDDSLSIG